MIITFGKKIFFDKFFLYFYGSVTAIFLIMLFITNFVFLNKERSAKSLEKEQSSSKTFEALYENTPVKSHQIRKDKIDPRVKKLMKFLKKRNSPLTEFSSHFVEVADRYYLDWRLLPAISCKESTCGKTIPWNHYENKPSYNPFGWGVYGTNAIYFESWQSSIEGVGKSIKEKYYDNGLTTPDLIEPIYNPQSLLKGHPWSHGVNSLMAEIENP